MRQGAEQSWKGLVLIDMVSKARAVYVVHMYLGRDFNVYGVCVCGTWVRVVFVCSGR